MGSCRWGFAFAAAVALAAAPTDATQDYGGEVHPQVSVENDQFVVTFMDNREDKHRVFRNVYSRDGQMLLMRSPGTSYPPFWFERLGFVRDGELEVRRANVRHSGPEPDQAWRRTKGDKVKLRFAEWVEVHDVISHDGKLIALVVAGPEQALVSWRFDLATGHSLDRTTLAMVPPHLHAKVSNVVPYRDGYLACWMEGEHTLRLSYWTPGRTPSTVSIAHGEWNTRPTLDVIGDDLLVAYHTRGKGAYATIVAVHVRLPLPDYGPAAPLDDAAAWMTMRAQQAQQGSPDLVRMPIALHSEGSGYRGPVRCIATNLMGDCGPAIQVMPWMRRTPSNTSRYGVTVVIAEGLFTGRKVGESWEFDAYSLQEAGGSADARLEVLAEGLRSVPSTAELRQGPNMDDW